MEKRDYYEVLGVARDADGNTIKRAYRKLAMQLHPDRNPGDAQAEEQFKEAAEAYEVLSSEEKRGLYDRFGHQGLRGHSGGGFRGGNVEDIFSHFGDIFGDLFGGGGGRRRRSGPRAGADLRYDLEIDFEEAVFGVKRELTLPRAERCERCEGKGSEPGTSPQTCEQCGGNGQIFHTQGFFRIATTCPMCRGKGQTIASPCKDCGGAGRVARERTVLVPIPAGVDTGARLRIRGEGEPGPSGGPPGDLYVVLHVRPHDVFERDGVHLYLFKDLPFVQAALGAHIQIPTLEGEATLDVPPGTQPGDELVIEGQGVPRVNGSGRGDLIVRVGVEVPRKLNKRQRELLVAYAEESGVEVSEKEGFFDRFKRKKK